MNKPLKSLTERFKRKIFSICLDVEIKNTHWPVYLDLYVLFFGKRYSSLAMRPNDFPDTIKLEDGDLYKQIQKLLNRYNIHRIRVKVSDKEIAKQLMTQIDIK